MTIKVHHFDAIVIGAGGSGLRAGLQLAQSGNNVAVISKVFPTRSHTVSAQGGIAASLGNMHEDKWLWHMYDTVKGADYIGDQNCIEYMCEVAPQAIYELEHMGMPFSRNENGTIYQRAFGGMSRDFDVGKIAQRTCAASDRTGHALLHTLYQANVKEKTTFFNEWYAIDLIKDSSSPNKIAGALVINMETGEHHIIKANITVLATGGAGTIFESNTNAYINTGDGIGMALRAGIPVQDMEFWQFHPTGIAGAGVLVTEGCRGEGGVLRNKDGERFMERYAPNAKDLASRDVVSRASTLEIREGIACDHNGVECVHLDLTHLGEDILKTRLPGISELAKTFANVDPVKQPIPVVPTCHYMMGGIPTNINGQVLTRSGSGKKEKDEIVEGLYAVGECACVSVHGANRLGSNSLLDLVVFGRAAGIHICDTLKQGVGEVNIDSSSVDKINDRINKWRNSKKGEKISVIKKDMQKAMQKDFSVFRTGKVMDKGLKALDELEERLQNAVLEDKSHYFNTNFIEALELENLMECALATAYSATHRTETRGAHAREDYPDHDNKNWIKHSLYYKYKGKKKHELASREVNMKPKKVDTFQPKERKY